MSSRRLGRVVGICVLLGFMIAPLTVIAGELTFLQAGGLVRLAFEYQVRNIKDRGNYSLDPQMQDLPLYPHFATFEVLGIWGDPEETPDTILGRFSVDRLTADVWDVYAECFLVDYPQLRKVQQVYREIYHLSKRRNLPPAKPRTC